MVLSGSRHCRARRRMSFFIRSRSPPEAYFARSDGAITRNLRSFRRGCMADVELLVEVRELAPGILEKETAADGERSAKQVHKEHGEEDENRDSVGVINDCFVPSHELQLVE